MAKDDEILGLLSKMIEEQREHRAETASSFFELDKKVDLHIQATEYELKRINNQDEIQNRLLDQHIEGVNTLKDMHLSHVEANKTQFKSVDEEITALKEPRKWASFTVKIFICLGGIGTAAMGLVKLVSWLKGI